MGAVARALRARGDAVIAFVRNPSRAASLSERGCELVAGDVVDPSDAIGELRRCDALIHGAAIYEIGVTAERRRVMEATNVTGTRGMLEAARAARTPRIVYVSTIAAFGNTHGKVVAEGFRPTSPATSAYEDTKRRAHEIALDAARSGAPIVIPSAVARLAGRFISSMREVVSSADGVTFWATDAKARAELGTKPRDLATGMRDVFGNRPG